MRRILSRLFVAIASASLMALAPVSGFAASSTDAAAPPAATGYALGPGDKIRVTVFDEPDLTRQVEVGADGYVSFPLVGSIPAAGGTPDAFGEKLAGALKKYLKEARVTVEIAEYRPFSIIGEVRSPGSYPYAPNLTVISAVARAGGFTYRAAKTTVFITRSNETKETKLRLSEAIVIHAGDTIRIGERIV